MADVVLDSLIPPLFLPLARKIVCTNLDIVFPLQGIRNHFAFFFFQCSTFTYTYSTTCFSSLFLFFFPLLIVLTLINLFAERDLARLL